MFSIEDKIKDFLDDFIDVIFDLLEKSINKGIELGFMLCQINDKIIPGGKCIGEECRVKVTDCSVGKPIGVIHTHTFGDAEPSRGDIVNMVYYGYSVGCIISNLTRNICCYKPNVNHPVILDMINRGKRCDEKRKYLEDKLEHIDELSEEERNELLYEVDRYHTEVLELNEKMYSYAPDDSYELIGCRRIKKIIEYE